MDIDFTKFPDHEIIVQLKRLLAEERVLQAEFLVYLGETDHRRLYAALGYSSLFAYCVEALGLSEGSAYKRIRVARMARVYPQIYALIRDRKISLSAVGELSPIVNDKNFPSYLTSACGKSKRATEELVASLLPNPDAPDRIRKLPASSQKITLPGESSSGNNSNPLPQPSISNELLKSSLGMEGGGGMRESQAFVFPAATPPLTHRDQLHPLSEDRVKISFTCNAEFRKKLEQLKGLLWHKYPEGKLEDILERALDVLLQHVSPELKFKSQRRSSTKNHSRHIPKSIKSLVWQRDGGRCQFRGADGQQCAAQRGLEFDHVHPWALGGQSHDPENIRLLCHTHNHHRAVLTFGIGHG